MTDNNYKYREKLIELIDQTFSRILKKGLYGECCFRIKIHDGNIQEIIREESEKIKTK